METGFEVEVTSEGRSGNVIYKEANNSLSFWWEFSTKGAYINIPADEKWDDFCEHAGFQNGKGRKVKIVERIASETKRQKALSAEIVIEEEWINLYF